MSTATYRVLLAITGGIAAYKMALLVRLLTQHNYQVRVVMTEAACQFITPLTMQALSGNAVHTALLDAEAERGMGHIELAKWADLVVIAPCSANTLGKLASGFADNLLTTVVLATKAPIWVCPAMNQAMWHSAPVQHNIQKLIQWGYRVIEPDSGAQACGDVGAGRLPEADTLYAHIALFFAQKHTPQLLHNKTVVITAGATLEPIDPVRYLSNHSTGKMGYALAQACLFAGARVILVAGQKVQLPTPLGVQKITVSTAQHMLQVCTEVCQNADILIAAAAVADFRAHHIATQKLKKTAQNDQLTLQLTKNPDILAQMAQQYPDMLAVGFAAETQDVEAYAQQKLISKNLDMIACNDVSDQNIGFGSDDNAMTVFFGKNHQKPPLKLPKAPKLQIAQQLVAAIAELITPAIK